jgi:hypothetical protein
LILKDGASFVCERDLSFSSPDIDCRPLTGPGTFFPTLDPKANRLDLMPSAPTIRAVIAVPLTDVAAEFRTS